MKPNQTAIYYIAAESRKAAEESPALEKLRKLNYEVLYLTEPLDEFCMQSLGINKFRGKEVIDVTKVGQKKTRRDKGGGIDRPARRMRLAAVCVSVCVCGAGGSEAR